MGGRKKSKSQHHLKQKKYLQLFHAAQLDALECACHGYSFSIGASIIVKQRGYRNRDGA